MPYKLKTRKTKPFELYNNLEAGDIAELGFFLKTGEGPRKSLKKIVAEHLWVKIKNIICDLEGRAKFASEGTHLFNGFCINRANDRYATRGKFKK